jgi:hypothetical protein
MQIIGALLAYAVYKLIFAGRYSDEKHKNESLE